MNPKQAHITLASIENRFGRRIPMKTLLPALLLPLFALTSLTGAEPEGEAMKTARREAAQRKRRVIYNNDGNDRPQGKVTPESFLASRTSALVGSHVDAIFYCTGVFNLYTHQSDESEQLGHDGEGRDMTWLKRLNAQGHDTLGLMVDFGHKHDMEVFWSIRMNDTHDSSPARPWLWTKWKEQHRHLLMLPRPAQSKYGWVNGPSWTWSAVNFEHKQVRDKVVRIIDDVVSRYDIDGIELDFTRFPVFFRPQMLGEPVTQEHCDTMTALLERVRAKTTAAARRRGRPMLIAVHVPDSVAYCRQIGLDLEAWLRLDLADLIVAAGDFQLEPWANIVSVGKRHGVPVYACLSASRIPSAPSAWRGEALWAWQSGVNGIATFNTIRPDHDLLRQLGDPDLLASLPKRQWYELSNVNQQKIVSLKHFLKGGERFLSDEVRARWSSPPRGLEE